jgi:hypothetical protein
MDFLHGDVKFNIQSLKLFLCLDLSTLTMLNDKES